jgi:hypothetical protein
LCAEHPNPRRISRFIEDLVRPHVMFPDLEAAYQRMAEDEEREFEENNKDACRKNRSDNKVDTTDCSNL